MIDFSIIIPTYNVEDYIRQCLDSCINQEKGKFIYEIIVIDDGSNDSTADILSYYEKMDNISVFYQDNDGAPGKARNVGINHAKGEYLIFLDGDDMLPPKTLIHFFETAVKYNKPDLIFGATRWFKENCNDVNHIVNFSDSLLKMHYKKKNTLDNYKTGFLTRNVQAKILKRSIIEKNKISFPHKVRSQDAAFMFMYFYCIDNYYFTNEVLYLRQERANPENLSLTQSFDNRIMNDRFNAGLIACNYFLDYHDQLASTIVYTHFIFHMFSRVRKNAIQFKEYKSYYKSLKEIYTNTLKKYTAPYSYLSKSELMKLFKIKLILSNKYTFMLILRYINYKDKKTSNI